VVIAQDHRGPPSTRQHTRPALIVQLLYWLLFSHLDPIPEPPHMLRVAIFSDVHGNLAALRAVLAAIDRHRPVQLRVAAGDLVSPAGARPAETLDLLLQAECALLLGNHDVLL